MTGRRAIWNAACGSAAAILVLFAAAVVLDNLDRRHPPPLAALDIVSSEVVDRNGTLLRAFATPQGRWRLKVGLDDIDPQFLDMLIAYEDRRFHDHHGIDPLAMLRAALQMMVNGRVVSGGSTLSMQLARLIEPRQSRSLASKIRQMLRALQIERRLSKEQILAAYLHVAPYGGNLEGVRAASLAWFGKEPKKLLLSEAALLVALPQRPEGRRPDRFSGNAKAARDRVLQRMASSGIIAASEIERASARPVPSRRRPLPLHAAHLADRAVRAKSETIRITTTLNRHTQTQLETVARDAARRLGPAISVALMVADASTGEILAEVGSSGYFDERRFGWIDMTRATRSPGSTLKPFIYGLAIQEGMVLPETMIADRPTNFAGYRPKNFDMTYQGDVTVRTALQMSLNVPALQLLEAVGPRRLAGLMRTGGATPRLPNGEALGLAIGLGGAGLSLKDLVQLYTVFPNRGQVARLGNGIDAEPSSRGSRTALNPVAAWHVSDILSGVVRPAAASPRTVGYKTGTSYGYRDAWAIGFDGRHVIGVWAGAADNRSVPGLTGISAAAPILFEAFAKSLLGPVPLPPAPPGALRIAARDLPQGLRHFAFGRDGLVPVGSTDPAPEIVYPPANARVELGMAHGGKLRPLVIKLQGGRAPFRWLANGEPLPVRSRRHTATWMPESRGYSTLTVIDADGQAASVKIFIN